MYQRVIKRFFDIVGSICILPFVLVVMVVVAIAIKLDDGGPIFYMAARMGKDRKPFKMFKFRSMKVNAPDLRTADGSTYNAEDDPRQTRVGRIIRKTAIDELPQFLNVLLGDMSIIGPRPDDLKEAELYEGEEHHKLDVKPGITGYAQVYGRNAIPWKQRLQQDLYYVKHISFLLDVKVFFKTFQVVLMREGVYVDPAHSVCDLNEAHNQSDAE